VAIQNWGVTSSYGSGVVEDDNLSFEVFDFSGGVIFVIRGNVSSSDFFN